MNKESLQQIELILGYNFSNSSLLEKAFTHSSVAENHLLSNERLEFFGDSVLSLVICQVLFERFPDYREGDLTKIKSMLVSRKICARIVKDLGLHNFLSVGKGMTRSRALTGSVAAGLLEAIIGAICVDAGFEKAREFILRIFGKLINQADAEQSQGNFKSLLQQYTQQRVDSMPLYDLLDEKGPDHNKCFEIQVVIDGRHFTSAWGNTKKEAEQKAAYNALTELGIVTSTLEEDSD